MEITVCPFLRMATFRIVMQAKVPFHFSGSEFKDNATIKALCQAIDAHAYGIRFNSLPNTLERLNELLETPDLFDRWFHRSDISVTKATDVTFAALNRLARATEAFRGKPFAELSKSQQQMIGRLNRLILEIAYSKFCPENLEEQIREWAGTGFVIHSGKEETLALTAAHVVEGLEKGTENAAFQAELYNGKLADLNLIAANPPSFYARGDDLALLALSTDQIGEELPALSLTSSLPPAWSQVLCLGFPGVQIDDFYRTKSCPANEIASLRVQLWGRPEGDRIQARPNAIDGFSGGPIIFENSVIGLIQLQDCNMGHSHLLCNRPSFTEGLSTNAIRRVLAKWRAGEIAPEDIVPHPINDSIKEVLVRLAKA